MSTPTGNLPFGSTPESAGAGAAPAASPPPLPLPDGTGPGWVGRWGGAVVRVAPSHAAGELARLPMGTQVVVEEVKGDFGRLQKPSHLVGGWLTMRRRGDSATLVSSKRPKQTQSPRFSGDTIVLYHAVVVAHDGVLVRKSEDLSSGDQDLICTLPSGTPVTVRETSGRRARLTAPVAGWVSLATERGQELVAMQRFQPPRGGWAESRPTERDFSEASSGVLSCTWASDSVSAPDGWQRCEEGWLPTRMFEPTSGGDSLRSVHGSAALFSAPSFESFRRKPVPVGESLSLSQPPPVRPPAPAPAGQGPIAAPPPVVASRSIEFSHQHQEHQHSDPGRSLTDGDPEGTSVFSLRHTPGDAKVGLSLSGCTVVGVGGAAGKAGVQAGSRIVRVGGTRLRGDETTSKVRSWIAAAPPTFDLVTITPCISDADSEAPLSLSPTVSHDVSHDHRGPWTPFPADKTAAAFYPIGSLVDVFHPGSCGWVQGTVTGFDHRRQSYEVQFDTGEAAAGLSTDSLRPPTGFSPVQPIASWPRGCFVLT
eukprot:Hpha_TRINITY_DN10113_c0_g2::TRINITY_DN10113_c0_g2_i1::g.131653::m.131653